MADSRLYILNRETGIAARFYSRSGLDYSVAHESIDALMAHATRESPTGDDFVIVDGDVYFERIGDGRLFRFIPQMPEKFRVDWRDEAMARKDKEIERLNGLLFTLSRVNNP